MANELAPGVTVQELTSSSLKIGSSLTAVPVFIGSFYDLAGNSISTDNSVLQKIVRVESWLDFTKKFGVCNKTPFTTKWTDVSAIKNGTRYDLTAEFIENNRFNRIKTHFNNFYHWFDFDAYYKVMLYFINGGGPCYIYPIHVTGELMSHKQDLDKAAENAALAIMTTPEITLAVMCVGRDAEGSAISLRTHPELKKCFENNNIFVIGGCSDVKKFNIKSVGKPEQTAVYAPLLIASQFLSIPKDFLDATINVTLATGAKADGGDAPAAKKLGELNVKKASQDDKALYAQIHDVLDNAEVPVIMFADSVMAGIYCHTDQTRGVWKAPANVALNGIASLSDYSLNPVRISDSDNTNYIDAGVNPIRCINGRAHLVWGSRTAVTSEQNDWKYIPVRRLFNAAESDIKQSLAQVVFEPNLPATWATINTAISSYLHNLWKQGALSGDTPEDAYFVAIGKGVTMSSSDISQGIIRVKVGMAAVKPAEFIILEFSQLTQGA